MTFTLEQRAVAAIKANNDNEKDAQAILEIIGSNLTDLPSIEVLANRIRERCRNAEARTIHTKGVHHAPR